MMKRLFLPFAAAAMLCAQVQTVPNTTFPGVRAILNSNFSWLNTNKAGNSSCSAGRFSVQTTTSGVVCLQVDWSVLSGLPSTFTPPAPGVSSLGGVRSLTCTGSEKISAIGTDGIPVCSADQTGEAGGGITTLNTLIGTSQTFAKVDDTNVTLAIGSLGTTHTWTAGWSGLLSIARGGTGASSTSQNYVFAGPTSGSGAPAFRALVAGDIPSLSYAATNAATTVNGQSCALGSTCTVADATKQATSEKDVNGGYVGRDGSGNAAIPGTVSANKVTTDPTKNAAESFDGAISGGLTWSIANVGGTAVTLLWPTDSGSATDDKVLAIKAVTTCPTLLPSWAPATCRNTAWVTASGTVSYGYHAYTGTSAVDFSAYNSVTVTASGGNPTITVSAVPASSGAPIQIALCNDGTARTWTLPATFKRILPPMLASTCVYNTATYDGTNYQGLGSDETPAVIRYTAERADPGAGNCPAGGCEFVDSTAHNKRFRNASDVVFGPVKAGADINVDTGVVAKVNGQTPGGTCTGQFVRVIDTSGRPTCQAIAAADLPPVTFPTPGTSVTLAGPSEYYECSGTCSITLPVPAAGYQFCIANAVGGTAAITINNPGTGVYFEKPDHSAYGTATTGTLVSTAGTFASVCLVGRDSTHYRVWGTPAGTWTAN